MFDFNDIHKESCEYDILNAELLHYINDKVRAILDNDEKNYPTRQEMEDWPDHIWKAKRFTEKYDNNITNFLGALPIKLSTCNLNWIDTSGIFNMDFLFGNSFFIGDISRWDVSNVVTMEYMFKKARFNGDISQWNVSSCKSFLGMFADSPFNGDLTPWVANGYLHPYTAQKFDLLKYMKHV